jgi:general stress protein 26
VDPFPPDENFSVWIATRPNTRKVAQIVENPKVTLYYFDDDERNYVTIMGTARLVTDDATKTAMRRPADSDRLYPDFPYDYLLIEVTSDWLEAIVPGYRGDRDTWRPASVHFQRD